MTESDCLDVLLRPKSASKAEQKQSSKRASGEGRSMQCVLYFMNPCEVRLWQRSLCVHVCLLVFWLMLGIHLKCVRNSSELLQLIHHRD